MDAAVIEVRELVKNYGRARALRGIDFQVPRGQIVGFLGPNGAGKTTTMKIITGYLEATSGQAFVRGVSVEENPLEARTHIGYLPENAPLYEDMMVQEFLDFVADIRQIPQPERRQRFRMMTEVCGIGDVLSKNIGELSKGFRQRVGLAHAMIHDPEILILDEPTSGLDPNQIAEIRKLIRELGQEKTLILSTHILPEVQATCDRVIIISEGKIVADDTVEGLMTGDSSRIRLLVAPRGETVLEREAVIDALSKPESVRSVSILEEVDEGLAVEVLSDGDVDARRDLFEAAVASDLALLEMQRRKVSLEETFRRLTMEDGGEHV